MGKPQNNPIQFRIDHDLLKLKSEHEEQVDFVQTLDLKKVPYFAVPNGMYLPIPPPITGVLRKMMEASVKTVIRKMKHEGMKAGVFDLFIMVPSGKYHGLFIEMKTKNGVVSDHQKSFKKQAENQGYKCVVSFGAIQAYKDLVQYINNP